MKKLTQVSENFIRVLLELFKNLLSHNHARRINIFIYLFIYNIFIQGNLFRYVTCSDTGPCYKIIYIYTINKIIKRN